MAAAQRRVAETSIDTRIRPKRAPARKALASAVTAVFDQPVIHRCQLHKIRNVEVKLPKALAQTVTRKNAA